jgi:hypothetical protein
MADAVSAPLRPARFRAGGKPMPGELEPGMGATVGKRPAGLPAVPAGGESTGRGCSDTGAPPSPEPAGGGLVVPVGGSAVTASDRAAVSDVAPLAVAVAVSSTCSVLVAAGSTADTAWSSKSCLLVTEGSAQLAPPGSGQIVNFGAPMFLAVATLAVTVTGSLVPTGLQTQITKSAVWPAWTCDEPENDWTWTHNCGGMGDDDDGLGLGLGDDELGLGLGDVGVGVGAGGVDVGVGGVDDGLLFGDVVGVAVVLAEAVGVADVVGSGVVLMDCVGVGSGEAVPDGSLADGERLTKAVVTASFAGRLAQTLGTACAVCCASEAAKTPELIVSSRKPAMPPTATGRTTDVVFTSAPSPSGLHRPPYWCSPCPFNYARAN